MSKQDEVKFVDGLIVKDAPVDFVKAKLSFKIEEFVEYANKNANNGWLNVDVLESKGGKLYAKLNDFKPESKNEVEDEADLPF